MLPLVLASAAVLLAASDDVKEIRKTVDLSPQGRVTVDTYKGSITVTTWDQPRVEVQVRIEADSWSISDREQVRNTEIEVDSSRDSLRLKTRYPKAGNSWFSGYQPLAKYTIRMPRTAQLRIKDYKSDIDVDSLSAPLDIDTYKGEVRVHKQGGPAQVKTYKSDARIDFARLNDRTSFETYKGSYEISLPRDARVEVRSDVGRRGSLRNSFAGMKQGPVMSLKGYRGEFTIR